MDQPNVASIFYGPVLLAAEESGSQDRLAPVTLDADDIGKSITGRSRARCASASTAWTSSRSTRPMTVTPSTCTLPSVGRMQMMLDPQGAAFYIYEPETADFPPEGTPEVGEAAWIELMTTDAPAAMTFYSEVFGWQPSEAMDMGEMGKYHMFNRPHGMIGGMMNKPPELAQVPPNWQIYFRVPDVDAAVARITANGGQVLNGPMEVPGGDRVLNGMDPQGAAFSLYSKKAG
jgi:uncharacterized protein